VFLNLIQINLNELKGIIFIKEEYDWFCTNKDNILNKYRQLFIKSISNKNKEELLKNVLSIPSIFRKGLLVFTDVQQDNNIMREIVKSEGIACRDAFEYMEEKGFSRRTVERAKINIGVKSIKKGQHWVWILE